MTVLVRYSIRSIGISDDKKLSVSKERATTLIVKLKIFAKR